MFGTQEKYPQCKWVIGGHEEPPLVLVKFNSVPPSYSSDGCIPEQELFEGLSAKEIARAMTIAGPPGGKRKRQGHECLGYSL